MTEEINNNTILSLTTLPGRIDKLDKLLDSIDNQIREINRCILWIPYEYKRFNSKLDDSKIPDYAKNHNIEIRRCDDHGPLTAMYMAYKISNKNDIILTIDDDVILHNTWSKGLINAINKHNCMVGYRGRVFNNLDSIVYLNSKLYEAKEHKVHVITTTWGAGYTKEMLDNVNWLDHSRIPESYYVDDIWISGNIAQKGINRLVISGNKVIPDSRTHNTQCLWHINKDTKHNENVIKYFAEYFKKDNL